MELLIYVNGKFLPQSEAKVSVFDHGLLYGDGVFEGIRAYNGRIFKLERHLDRLFQSAKAIDLKLPHSKEEFTRIILETCRRNDTLVTPFTSTNLPGVTREAVLEIAPKLNLETKEQFFTLYDVWAADEAFITGSAAEVAPVVEVDGRTIGDGKPGPTTKALMKAFRDLVMSTGTPI